MIFRMTGLQLAPQQCDLIDYFLLLPFGPSEDLRVAPRILVGKRGFLRVSSRLRTSEQAARGRILGLEEAALPASSTLNPDLFFNPCVL